MPTSEGIAKLASSEGKRLAMPEDLHWYSAAPFGSMNQQDSRTRMEDTEFYWVENFLKTGNAKLRTLRDQGAALYTAPTGKTVVYFSWFNINGKVAVAVFLSDGTAYSVDYPSGTVTLIGGAPGLFYTGGQLPWAVQSGDQFLLICNNITPNSYWVWDGTLLYATGQLAPYQTGDLTSAGTGYTSAPTLTIYGGSGTGATATATVFDGSVVAITVTNPGTGYSPSDNEVQVQFAGGGSDTGAILNALMSPGGVNDVELISGGSGYTTAPTILFTGGGGGSGAAAVATVASGAVTAITVTSQGANYISTPTVVFSGGGGVGASAVATLSPGFVASIQIANGGNGYVGTPTLTFQGGGGSGAAAVAIISAGSITGFTLSSGGAGYTSPPLIIVETGLNRAAAATLNVMPFGVSGTSIETFQSRIWISDPAQIGPTPTGGVFNVSATGSITDFATSDGGDLFTNSDRYLRQRYTAMHQSNGYLYSIGDSSVSVVSNVQTTGNPPSTTFNYQNTSDQIGTSWRDTVQDYGQSIIMANANGIQGLYGGAVQRISKKLDDIFVNAFPVGTNGQVTMLPGAVTPSAAVANILTIPIYLLNLTLLDPTTNTTRTVMIGWNEKEFFIGVQASAMIFIGTQEVNSSMTAWGTDGSGLYPLFTTPSATLPKKLVTKMWGADQPFVIKTPLVPYIRATDKSTGQAGLAMTLTMESAGIAQQIGQQAQLPTYAVANVVQPNFTAPNYQYPVWAAEATAVAGTALGMTLVSAAPDFELTDLTVCYRNTGPLFG